MMRLLFVCTGNTCRSPLAEAMFRERAAKAGIVAEVRSAGIMTSGGMPISHHSASILRDKGIEVSHSSRILSDSLIHWADIILTMTQGHKRSLIARFPDAVDKVHMLREYVEDDSDTLRDAAEREELTVELQVKEALGQPVQAEERERLARLMQTVPNYDIADPFGGSLADYKQCAEELDACLHKLISKLRT